MDSDMTTDRIRVGVSLFMAIKASPEMRGCIEVVWPGPELFLCGTLIVPDSKAYEWSMEAIPEGTYCEAWFRIHDVLRAHLQSPTPPVEG